MTPTGRSCRPASDVDRVQHHQSSRFAFQSPARDLRQRKSVHLPIFASSDGVHKTSVVALVLRPEPFAKGETPHQISMLQETHFLKVHIGGENGQVDRCCLCLGRLNICAGHVTRAASSAGQHDRASPPRMRRGYAHDQWQMRDHICPPPRPPRCHPPTRISRSLRRPAAAISALIL